MKTEEQLFNEIMAGRISCFMSPGCNGFRHKSYDDYLWCVSGVLCDYLQKLVRTNYRWENLEMKRELAYILDASRIQRARELMKDSVIEYRLQFSETQKEFEDKVRSNFDPICRSLAKKWRTENGG